ncbi:MAG: hypothetical protein ACOY71_04525 [Gemmatimonadota bacterium]
MNPPPEPPRKSPAPTPGGGRGDFYRAVEQVIRSEVSRKEEERARARADAARRRRRSRLVMGVSLTVLLATVGYLGVTRPDWLFPNRPLSEPPELREASLRAALFMEAQRILRFRDRHGQLPVSLAEAGSPRSEFHYEPSPDGRFTLTGSSGPLTLTYRSDQPAKDFLGGSFLHLRQRATKP